MLNQQRFFLRVEQVNLTILRLKGVLFNIKIEGNILLLVQLNIQVYTMLVFS